MKEPADVTCLLCLRFSARKDVFSFLDYSTTERAVQHTHQAPPLSAMADTTDTGLLRLPNELILDISDLLPTTGGLNALARTNHRTYALLNRYLYGRDAQGSNGNAIRWAAEKGLVRTAGLALEAGTDAEIALSKDLDLPRKETWWLPTIIRHDRTPRFTPLQLSIAYKHQAVAIFLIHHGANTKARLYHSEQNLSILHVASGLGLVGVMQALLDKGAKMQTRDKYDQTPLHHAVRPSLYGRAGGNAAAVALLMDKGASITTPNRDRRTPQILSSTTTGLISGFWRLDCCSLHLKPEPVLDYEIGELLRNKAVVLKMQKLDTERAKKMEKKAGKRESVRGRPQRKC